MSARSAGGPPAFVIVDDDPDHAMIMRRLLGEIAPAAPVALVSEAESMVARLSDAPERALVLIDRNLHGHDALEYLAAVRAQRPDLTLVVLSAALAEPERRRALAAGAHDAAQKPSSIAQWRDLLRDLVALSAERPAAAA